MGLPIPGYEEFMKGLDGSPFFKVTLTEAGPVLETNIPQELITAVLVATVVALSSGKLAAKEEKQTVN